MVLGGSYCDTPVDPLLSRPEAARLRGAVHLPAHGRTLARAQDRAQEKVSRQLWEVGWVWEGQPRRS